MAGFRVGDQTYPLPTRFRLGDPVLIQELTGLPFDEFAELLADETSRDPRRLIGMVGVAVWQKHERWTRDRALRFVESLDMESLELEAEDDAGPPDGPAARSSRSRDTSAVSTTSQED